MNVCCVMDQPSVLCLHVLYYVRVHYQMQETVMYRMLSVKVQSKETDLRNKLFIRGVCESWGLFFICGLLSYLDFIVDDLI